MLDDRPTFKKAVEQFLKEYGVMAWPPNTPQYAILSTEKKDIHGSLRIPTEAGQGYRFDVGHRSDLKPATIPI